QRRRGGASRGGDADSGGGAGSGRGAASGAGGGSALNRRAGSASRASADSAAVLAQLPNSFWARAGWASRPWGAAAASGSQRACLSFMLLPIGPQGPRDR